LVVDPWENGLFDDLCEVYRIVPVNRCIRTGVWKWMTVVSAVVRLVVSIPPALSPITRPYLVRGNVKVSVRVCTDLERNPIDMFRKIGDIEGHNESLQLVGWKY
jgi:hypothetical protein